MIPRFHYNFPNSSSSSNNSNNRNRSNNSSRRGGSVNNRNGRQSSALQKSLQLISNSQNDYSNYSTSFGGSVVSVFDTPFGSIAQQNSVPVSLVDIMRGNVELDNGEVEIECDLYSIEKQFHYYCQTGDIYNMKETLKKGKKISSGVYKNEYPIFAAIRNSQFEIVKILLEECGCTKYGYIENVNSEIRHRGFFLIAFRANSCRDRW